MKLRLGKKQKRAVLDSKGNEIVVFPKGKEWYAKKFVELFNKDTEQGLFEEEISKVPWYINVLTNIKFWVIDFKNKLKK